jgi:hypothetical protein
MEEEQSIPNRVFFHFDLIENLPDRKIIMDYQDQSLMVVKHEVKDDD